MFRLLLFAAGLAQTFRRGLPGFGGPLRRGILRDDLHHGFRLAAGHCRSGLRRRNFGIRAGKDLALAGARYNAS